MLLAFLALFCLGFSYTSLIELRLYLSMVLPPLLRPYTSVSPRHLVLFSLSFTLILFFFFLSLSSFFGKFVRSSTQIQLKKDNTLSNSNTKLSLSSHPPSRWVKTICIANRHNFILICIQLELVAIRPEHHHYMSEYKTEVN